MGYDGLSAEQPGGKQFQVEYVLAEPRPIKIDEIGKSTHAQNNDHQ